MTDFHNDINAYILAVVGPEGVAQATDFRVKSWGRVSRNPDFRPEQDQWLARRVSRTVPPLAVLAGVMGRMW